MGVVNDTKWGAGQADLPILAHVAGRTLERTIRQLSSDGWDDEAFAGYF